MSITYAISDVDMWEKDAMITIGGIDKAFYFQFSNEPTFAAALHYLYREGEIEIKDVRNETREQRT